MLIVSALPCRGADRRLVHREPTPFGTIFVVDEQDMRFLRFEKVDGDDQSMISLKDPDAVPMDYVRYALIGLAYIRAPRRALMLGLGGGAFTNVLFKTHPQVRIDAVEICPAVVRVARKYFGVPDDPRYRIHVGDGLDYVTTSRTRYDLIFVDAYGNADEIPAHLTTQAFLSRIHARLAAHGAVVFNVSTEAAAEAALLAEFKKAFKAVACFRTPEQNLILIGQDHERMPGRRQLGSRASRLTLERRLSFDLGKVAAQLNPACKL